MRIALLCNDDITTNIIFSKLFSSTFCNVAAVYFAKSPLPFASNSLFAASYLLKEVAFPYWVYLVFTNAIQKAFNIMTTILDLEPQHGLLCSVKKLASNSGIPVKTVDSFSSTEFEDEIKALQLDLLIVRVGEILPTQVFSSPRLGTWCVHSSILPSARGIAGEFHVLRNANLPMGSTIFRISENLDSGPVIAQTNIPKQQEKSLFWHVAENNNQAAVMLKKLLQELDECGQIQPHVRHDNLKPSYFGWPKQNDLKEFRSGGFELIKISEAVKLVLNALRLR